MTHFLVTGHTGFKGYWLSALLRSRGHLVSGLSLNSDPDSLYSRSSQNGDFTHDLRVDVRDRKRVLQAFRRVAPDYVFHLAAQSLVREGYNDPAYTYETNVGGTLNVLESIVESPSVRAALIVTSDKVYANAGSGRPFLESDPLGGSDPYSASKAMADIAAQEYARRSLGKPIGIARAGNVIGAGDSSKDRLLPDFVRSVLSNHPLVLRYPDAVRPWQHVLDCLHGYILLLDLLESGGSRGAYNFGPSPVTIASVRDVVDLASGLLSRSKGMIADEAPTLHEDSMLVVDASRAGHDLGWSDVFNLQESVMDALFDAWNHSGTPIRNHVESTIAHWENMRRAS